MLDQKQLPYLISLLDDKSPTIQQAVLKGLSSYGKDLNLFLDQIMPCVSEATKRKIQEKLSQYYVKENGNQWLNWLEEKDEYVRLERAMIFLSSFQNGFKDNGFITATLDQLAESYILATESINIFSLILFLCEKEHFVGERKDYYNPRNSDLACVLKDKRGLPILLVIIYMLVGKRAGLEIKGFNFPGHFMAISLWREENYLIDCFNSGSIFKEYDFLSSNIQGDIGVARKLFRSNAKIIIGRVLRNLAKAYEVSCDEIRSRQTLELLKELGV